MDQCSSKEAVIAWETLMVLNNEIQYFEEKPLYIALKKESKKEED